jgi:threonine dehydratase
MKVELKDIQEAAVRLKGTIKETSLDRSFSASKLLGTDVFFKFENEQVTGSFKIRGAFNKIASLTPAEKAKGVICSSAGNHAQGVAFSAANAGVRAIIVMPETAPIIKVNATKEYGAEVVLHGEIYDQAYERARELEKEQGYTFVPPFEDPKVIAGQGTIGLEIHSKVDDLDSIVVPIGGGGLISGIAIALKTLNPKIRVIGVQSDRAQGMFQLFHKASVTQLQKRIATIADGIAVKYPSQVMYENFIKKYVDEVVTVSDEEIAEAIFFLIERAKAVSEGSGAAAFAAAMHRNLNLGKKSCIVISGGNIDLNIISKVIDQGLVKKGRLVELSVVGNDVPGLLSQLTTMIAKERANILQVYHDRADLNLQLRETKVVFLLETTSHEHVQRIKNILQQVEGLRIL